jgi:hypothetical protein
MRMRTSAVRLLVRLAVLAAMMFSAYTPISAAVTIRFYELPPQPVDGLSFQGVTFFYTLGTAPSTEAVFGSFGPQETVFTQAPSLEGNARGSLWVLFNRPTSFLVFGLVRSYFGMLPQGAVVDLFDGSFSFIARKTVPVSSYGTSPFFPGQPSYSENVFNLPPATTPPVRLVRIVFPQADLAPRFVLDNLSYDIPSGPFITSTPSPVEAWIRGLLKAGIDPPLNAPSFSPDVIRQLQTAKPGSGTPGKAWGTK